MSNNQDTLLKETKDLLETAQKEVLKEINNKKNWISKIFAKDDGNSLKQAQSSISKAINQMKNFVKDEASLVVKLQNHLNDKNSAFKKLEEDFLKSQTESNSLRDKIKFFEAEFEKLKQEKSQAAESSRDQEPKMVFDQKAQEELKDRIKALEEGNHNLQKKYEISQEDLQESQKLAVELSGRIKRLKSEIVSSN
jgi:chromosome segregation ATPase